MSANKTFWEDFGMDKKVTGIIAYLTIIGWLIAYLAGDREGAKFHLNQALVLGICSIIASALAWIPIVRLFVYAIDLAIFIFCVIGIINAANDEEKPLPIIGGIKLLK